MKTASMTQQQKREKAAELLGWKREKSPFTRDCTTIHNDISGNVWWHPDVAGCQIMSPRYDEDLNLMHEAENGMTQRQYDRFRDKLVAVIIHQHRDSDQKDYARLYASATAAQRLDAWLEVMMEEKP